MKSPLSEATPHIPAGRRLVLVVVATVLLALGVAVLIAKAAGFGRVRDVTEDADSTWFFVCFFAEVASFSAYAVVVREALRRNGGPTASFGLSMHVTLASLGATRIVAAAGAGGLAVTYWSFRRARLSFQDAFVRVLGLNTLVYLVFALGAWLAALHAPLGLTLPWIVVVPVCVLLGRFVTEPERVDRLSEASGKVIRRGLGYAIAGTAWVRDAIGEETGRRAAFGAAVYWTGDVVCLWAGLHSVGLSLPLSELVLAYATGYVAMVLPLPFAGVGGVDAAMTFALTAVGLPLAPALVGVAVYRLFGFWVPTIPALAALVLLPRAARGLEQAATP
jgi:putative heme transporter